MSLRPPSTPRASIGGNGLPQPSSALPTPRRKSAISSTARPPSAQALLGQGELDSLRQAVRKNDPGRYDSPAANGGLDSASDSPSPAEVGLAVSTPGAGPRARNLGRKPSLMNVRTPLGSSFGSRPTTPSSSTPRTPTYARSRTPTGFGSSVSARPSTSKTKEPEFEVGDEVKIEAGGVQMEGTVRFLGEVEGKDGIWGGVELDEAWAGQGKNDGSVKGTQYFACSPLCGLFLPLGKITPKNNLAASTATVTAPKLTAGSRAARLAGTTAADLATKRRTSMAPPPVPSSPTKAASTPTARRVASPEKGSSMSTPRPTRLAGRASIGGGFGLASGRKSIGPSGTPRQSLGASIKRPPSSLRNHAMPDVPPIPSAFGLDRSHTPSSTAGRATPSTPGAISRRMSVATESSSISRPTTPSVRSYSRQSFASSVSRQSHRSNAGEDADLIEELRTQLAEGAEREKSVRKLLEGSESLGREMEDRLAERSDQLKERDERIVLLEKERERERIREEERLAGVGEEEGAKEKELARLRELEDRIDELLRNETTSKAATDKLTREYETKFAAKEVEAESLRERMAAAIKDAEEERLDLNRQLDQLRGAGQALCETYEERIADIELSRLEAVDLAESLQEQLERARGLSATSSRPGSPASPTSRLSSSHASSHTSAADVINAENALADLEHSRSKVATLEEQLEEARMHLEAEMSDSKRRRGKHAENEQLLKKEIKTLKEAIERSTKGDARATARIAELEDALHESQATLEEERSELEGLRHEGGATVGLADEVKRANKQIASIKADRDRQIELVNDLRRDLQAVQKELELAQTSSLVRVDSTDSDQVGQLRPRTPVQQPTQDTPNRLPSPTSLRKRDSIASSGSRRSMTGKEDVVVRDEIVGLKMLLSQAEDDNKHLLERNKELMVESQELKDAQRALEATVENMMAEMSSGAKPSSPLLERRGSSQLAEGPLRREVDDLKTKLRDAEKRAEREIKALNQEVSELESLVESKIYREDELETEIAKLKAAGDRSDSRSTASTARSRQASVSAQGAAADEEECEMCGELGHQLDDCPVFAGSAGSPIKPHHSPLPDTPSMNGTAEYCDDCETYGHSLENCTLSSEIF